MSFGIPVRNGLSVGLLASTFLTSGSGRLVPRLTLNFLTGAPLDSRITFSRTTNATLVDATGRVTYAPNNQVLRSEEFNDAGWTKDTATVTANATVAPDGTTTADKAIPNNGADLTSIANGAVRQAVTFPAGATLVFSVFAKEAEFDRIELYFSEGTGTANRATVTYSLVDGSVVTAAAVAGTFTNVSSTSTSVGNGWYRLTLTFTSGTATSARARFAVRDSGTTTGDGISGIFIWGAQLEQVTYQTLPSTYVQTVASVYYGPRFDYNPLTLAPRGLLIEEQRTNLALQSQTFDTGWSTADNVSITANTAIAPDGTTSADTLAETAVTGIHTASQSSSAAGVLTLSVFAKANSGTPFLTIGLSRSGTDCCSATFNLNLGTNTASQASGTYSGVSATITAAPQGFYRCTLTVTTDTVSLVRIGLNNTGAPTATNRNFGVAYLGVVTNSIFVWGAQLEAGAFATSYIPTVASTVTRAADVAVMTGANFSSWYNQSEGTIVVNADSSRGGVGGAARTFVFNNGTSSNNIRNGGQSTLQVLDANVTQVSIAGTPLIPFDGTVFKFASAYKENDFATVTTGAVATDTSGTVPTVNQLLLGSGETSTTYLNGHIRTFTYYATRLTNAQLQALAS